MKKIGKAFMKVIIVFMIVYFVMVSYSFVSINVMKNRYVSLFGYTFFEVASGSMMPTVKVGDIVVVKLDSLYDVGDIVTYESDSSYITHRVMEIDDNYIVAKGDANNVIDGSINRNKVIGKVVFVLKSIYLWKKVILNVRVFVSFLITMVLFILAFSYKNIYKLKRFRMRKIHYKDNKKKRLIRKKKGTKRGKKI